MAGDPDQMPDHPSVERYEHERKKDFEIAAGDSDLIDAVTEHIERHLGKIDTVYHELISDLVHIDVHVIPPSEARPCWTLVTSGMSERPMNPPPQLREQLEVDLYAELVISLPPDWPMEQSAWDDEANYWPIRWLKMIARLPHEYDTWVGFGHTIPTGDPAEPYADNTKLCCMLLLPGITLPEEMHQLKLPDGREVDFFALYPLYEDEMNFKLKKGTDALLERFEEHQVLDIVDIHRKSVCPKRWWRWW